MNLSELTIQNFRNINSAHLEFIDTVNIITGENGSGKTALLEAIYFLGHAKSFRTSNSKSLIQNNHSHYSLFAKITSENKTKQRLGIKKDVKSQIIRLNGINLISNAKLAKTLPLILLTPESHRLLSDGPKQRRRLMDWSLFHVKQEYHQFWKEYYKILSQRNSLLRNNTRSVELEYWTDALAHASQNLHTLRSMYDKNVSLRFSEIIYKLLGIEIELKYQPGWSKEFDLRTLLNKKTDDDIKHGYTYFGAHRADLKFKCGRDDAIQVLSRGQLKIMILALLIAQAQFVHENTGVFPVVLVDDLPAELDSTNRLSVLSNLLSLNTQIFITSTSSDLLPKIKTSHRMFHVEHGYWTKVV